MNYKIIKTEEHYEVMLEEAEKLMDAKTNTPQGDRLELVVLLLEKYEEEHYSIEPPNSIEAIKFRMKQMSLRQKDLINKD